MYLEWFVVEKKFFDGLTRLRDAFRLRQGYGGQDGGQDGLLPEGEWRSGSSPKTLEL